MTRSMHARMIGWRLWPWSAGGDPVIFALLWELQLEKGCFTEICASIVGHLGILSSSSCG